jgi:wobble nucleotide-excising tRNase
VPVARPAVVVVQSEPGARLTPPRPVVSGQNQRHDGAQLPQKGMEMFTNINVLHGAGVLDGYKGADARLPDFGRYNLIYGWNASGKTTLARFFRLMERPDGAKFPSGAYAEFCTAQGTTDTRNEQDRAQCPVRVFNSDFVEDNLQRGHTTATALFIVGNENIRLSRHIALFTHQRQRMARIYKNAKERNDGAVKIREGQATSLAAECGSILGIRNFRAPDLKGIAPRIGSAADTHMLDGDALETAITAARDQTSYATIALPLYRVPPSLPMPADFAQLLGGTPHQQTITRLAQNRELSDWVRAGLHIHQGKIQCEFCGGDATQAMAEYARHFSDEYQQQHSAIQAAIRGLEGYPTETQLPHQSVWIPSLRDRFDGLEQRLRQWLLDERKIRVGWVTQLTQKLGQMGSVIEVQPAGNRLSELMTIAAELDALAKEHNKACAEAKDLRREAADRVKNHFAARYLFDPESIEAETTVAATKTLLNRVDGKGKIVRSKLDAAQEELQRSSVAASEINQHLRLIMGDRVSVAQGADNTLSFMRGNEVATNLSDGEKTAVSLAYFLVSLKQNGQQIEQTVVFIDDPICSLDANHIYDVAYLLLGQLKNAKQVFVSTHNSEFFNTVKREWSENKEFKSGYRGYLVYRKGAGTSELVVLPKHLAKFRSDYHHVFYCLQKMQTSTSADVDYYLGTPNLLRRFLEMYLGFRKPAGGSYESKLNLLIDDEAERKSVARFTDEGSHSQFTNRLLEYADFPAMARGMVDRVLRGLEAKDPEHHAALREATQD